MLLEDFGYNNNCSRTKWVSNTYLGTMSLEVKGAYESPNMGLFRTKSCGDLTSKVFES